MNSKLYVGNLSHEVKDADLDTLFSESGTVKSINIIKDKYSGKVKGFGFIEMKSSEDAINAIKDLHEQEFMGQKIRVDYATENKRNSTNRR